MFVENDPSKPTCWVAQPPLSTLGALGGSYVGFLAILVERVNWGRVECFPSYPCGPGQLGTS